MGGNEGTANVVVLAASRGGMRALCRIHFTHVVCGVTRIWSQDENAADAALEFESGDGVRTVLRLHGAARPAGQRAQ